MKDGEPTTVEQLPSLAAATVQRFGYRSVTDVVGGFQAWRAAGLPSIPSG